MMKLLFLLAMLAVAALGVPEEGQKVFEEGQKKAQVLSKKLQRKKLSLEKGDELPEKLQKDADEVVQLFTEAADAGYAEAQRALGGMFNVGYMVEKNDEKAIKYFTMAADQGNLDSISNLATMYKDGVGVERDIGKAVLLFEEASAGGHDTASFNLASLYATGAGGALDVDLEKARDLLKGVSEKDGRLPVKEALGQVEAMIMKNAGEL